MKKTKLFIDENMIEHPCTLVSEIASVHYLNYEGGKISKTNNRGIFGDEVMRKGIHTDYWRYYLMKIRAEDGIGTTGHQRGDANFTWRDFVDSCNADLAKNYGNLVHRTFDLVHKYFGGNVDMSSFKFDGTFEFRRNKLMGMCDESYERNMIGPAIWSILELCNLTNKMLTDVAPWSRYKKNSNDPEILRAIGTALSTVQIITKMFSPIMPETTGLILSFYEEKNGMMCIRPGFTPFFNFIKV
ncbi:Methionyl-tRNA synthetase [uncultured virus]|nr:Methionyl-tRNA synthetase [uncultured virus]